MTAPLTQEQQAIKHSADVDTIRPEFQNFWNSFYNERRNYFRIRSPSTVMMMKSAAWEAFKSAKGL